MSPDGDGPTAEEPSEGTNAVLRTRHEAPAVVAGAVAPDNTDRMATRVEGDRVVTRIEREDAGGLRATVDDYVVNVRAADAVHAVAGGTDAERHDSATADTGESTARPTDSDTPTHDTHDT